ncbi:RNA 2',3'-cyclic phosphodiesterase [Amycolatopsis sp. NPDC059027]|uniref:RNA 2',3'-cyclic phosphodiesterase n=1 Tax=Amycolatopsis sp. NPDC059027 TaxID=3346709 RepID=UPI003670D222
MHVFSALVPPADVVDALAAELGERGDNRLRWSSPEDWHVTLGFYGHADAAERAGWLRERLAGRPAIDVRLENAGTFPGVLWLTVAGEGLTALALAAGADAETRPYRAHLTVARFPREEPELARLWKTRLSRFSSRAWTATEVALMRSERTPDGPRYRVTDRFPLERA